MTENPPYSRRTFVQLLALFGAECALGPETWAATVVAKVRALAQSEGGLLRLKLSDFPPLQQDFGSVRVGTSVIGSDHYPTGLFYPVLINRAPNARFFALDSSCSHEGCTVPILDPALHYMQCLCHGSQYSIDGTVRRGPANFPLRQFTTHFDGLDALTIELPDVSFSLEALQVQTGSGRVRLDFVAFEQIEYELRYRPNLASEWQGPIPFALTPEAPADQIILVGSANNAQVFIEQTSRVGFYAVVMRVKQV